MAFEHRYLRRVEFPDTDMAGIVHFSNYFRYMESADHDMLHALGIPVYERDPAAIVWPRVHVECSYMRALYYADEVEIHVCIRERSASGFTLQYTLCRHSAPDQPVVARGIARIACTRFDTAQQRLRSVAMPPAIACKLEPASAARLQEHWESKRRLP